MATLDSSADIDTDAPPLEPGALAAHVRALLEEGRNDEANRAATAGLARWPDDASLLHMSALACAALGRFAEGASRLRRALDTGGPQPDLLHDLGFILEKDSDLRGSSDAYRRSLALRPDSASTHYNLGNVLLACGDAAGAARHYETATHLLPGNEHYHNNLANALRQAGRLDDAQQHYQRALAINPGFGKALANLGSMLVDEGRLEEGEVLLRRALDSDPAAEYTLNNAGVALQYQGDCDAALGFFNVALVLAPEGAETHSNRFWSLFLAGRVEQAWPEYRWRGLSNPGSVMPPPFPVWDGSDPQARHLLLYQEQGIGDDIMNAAFVPEVASRCRKVSLQCEPRLVSLFTRSFPGVDVIGARQREEDWVSKIGDADLCLPLGDLPRLQRPRRESFDPPASYLRADPDGVQAWRRRLDRLGPGLKVGIAWHGGSRRKDVRMRSLPLENWREILALPDVDFVSLQHGVEAGDVRRVGETLGTSLTHFDEIDPLQELEQFAALIMALDIVLSVDNSTVHLAGALGVPTWVMLPHVPDWRWLMHGERTLWYRSLRLIRQARPGEWADVLARVRDGLGTMASFHRQLTPGRDALSAIALSWPIGEDRGGGDDQPTPAHPLLQRGMSLLDQRSIAEAEQAFRQALAVPSAQAYAWRGIAAVAGLVGQRAAAVDYLEQAQLAAPGEAALLLDLARARRTVGQLQQALACGREALWRRYDDSQAHYEVACIYRELGRDAEAIAHLHVALALNPEHASACNDLGVLLYQRGNAAEAVTQLRRALVLKPDWADASNNLGLALHNIGKREEALKVYNKLIAQQQKYVEAHYNRALLYHDCGVLDLAVDGYREALRLNPKLLQAANNLGNALTNSGLVDEAIATFDALLAENPDYEAAARNRLYAMNYSTRLSRGEVASAHAEWGRRFAAPRFPRPRPRGDVDPQAELRVGLVSADLRQHAVSRFVSAWLRHSGQAGIEVTCYSSVARPDARSKELGRLASRWCDISRLDDAAAARRIADDGIDVLVDLGGHTAATRARIAAWRPAALQITGVGYPNGTGSPAFDYRLGDDVTDPPAEEAPALERVLRIEGGFLCYEPPADAPPVSPAPALANGHITFGSFNDLAKVNADVIARWSGILHRVPGSRLLLKTKFLAGEGTRARVRRAFNAHGIDDARLDLMPWAPSMHEHLRCYEGVDVALDPFPYNGATTTCEALWMGVPVVTLSGYAHAGRIGASLLRQVGMAQLIAPDHDSYVARAVGLARDMDKLSRTRKSLRVRMAASRLCDQAAHAASFGRALRRAWRETVEQGHSGE